MKTTPLVATALAAALALSACGGGSSGTEPGDVNPSGQVKPREISWLLSRPANGSVITIMSQLADEYAKSHPGFKLNLVTTPDRPSYIQKYETLAAANKLPELFDTDATPFAAKLAKQGRMVDAEKLLNEANEKIARLRCAADLLVAAEFWGENAKDKLERVRHASNQSVLYFEKGPTEEFEKVAAPRGDSRRSSHAHRGDQVREVVRQHVGERAAGEVGKAAPLGEGGAVEGLLLSRRPDRPAGELEAVAEEQVPVD